MADRLGRRTPKHTHALEVMELDGRLYVTNEQEIYDLDWALDGGLERREFGFAINRPFGRQANQIIKAYGLTHGLDYSHAGDALGTYVPRRVRAIEYHYGARAQLLCHRPAQVDFPDRIARATDGLIRMVAAKFREQISLSIWHLDGELRE